MGMNLMYSPLETIFEATMEREGRTVTAYTSGSQFQAFMRRNDDGNNYEDRITLFYSVTAPIIQGSLVSYGNKIYILVNRETEENHCYYKSSALACNGMITLNDGTVIGVPCYGSSMKNGLVEQNSVMAMIDGNMEFITESNSLSRNIKIGSTFNEFGRTWKIDNIYYKDGILHIVTEVSANEAPYEKYEIFIDGLTQDIYDIGDTIQLSATPYFNNVVTTGTFTWESTNTDVATIDGEGLVTFVGNGTTNFKVYWVEKNVEEMSNTVGVGITEFFTVSIEGRTSLTMTYRRTYTAKLKDMSGNVQDGATWEWSFDFMDKDSVSFIPYQDKVQITVDDNDNFIGEILTVTVRETTKDISASIDVEIESLW